MSDMKIITSDTIAASEDLKNIERLEKLLENESQNMRLVFQEYVIAKKDPQYYFKELNERKDSFVKNLGTMLLNGSLYESDHKDFTEYDEIVGKIQKEFENDDSFVSELIVSMCKVFLGLRKKDPKSAWHRMRTLANSCECDWTK